MRAPFAIVNLDNGESVQLESLYLDAPVALVFLRHFGCIFCREQIASLRSFATENIVLVTMGNQVATADFKRKMEIPQRLISDPTKALYQDFGLRRATLGQFVNANVVRKGLSALRAGHREGFPTHDPLQLAGVFIIDRSGEVVFEKLSKDSSDNMTGAEIAAELGRVSQ